MFPRTERFESATIILPVVNETTSLRKTVEIILAEVKREWIKELLVVVCKHTTPESLATIGQLQQQLSGLMSVHHQKLPFLGGALRETFDLARGSHLVMMASDLETDPHDVPVLLARAQNNPAAIIAGSRWLGSVRFEGYSKIKLVCNWLFQRFFSILFGTHLTDMTFAFRVYPTALVQAIRWEELRHPFLFETLVKPLRLGVEVIEVPSLWRVREEGESQNTFLRNFVYFKTGLRTRFASPQALLKAPSGPI